jgi:hypothetical protein
MASTQTQTKSDDKKVGKAQDALARQGNAALAMPEGYDPGEWSEDVTDREIISFDKWDDHDVEADDGIKLNDQWVEGYLVAPDRLKDATEDMKAWDVLVFKLTKPIKNLTEEGAVYDVPAKTYVVVTKVFKLAHLEALTKDPNNIYKVAFRRNGQKKLKGPRAPMKLFKILISRKPGKRIEVAPASAMALGASPVTPVAPQLPAPSDA